MPKQEPDAPSTLDVLAESFNDLHRRVGASTSNALDAALDAGDVLIAAQDRVPKGAWNRWLRSHSIPISTAALYVQLAQNRSKIEAEIDRFGVLSLRAARKLVADPRASRTSSTSRPNFKKELAQARRKIAELQAELARAKAASTVLDKPAKLLAKALSLVKIANDPNTSPSSIESGRNEALATLHALYTVLLAKGIDVNDIIISVASGGSRQHRKAA